MLSMKTNSFLLRLRLFCCMNRFLLDIDACDKLGDISIPPRVDVTNSSIIIHIYRVKVRKTIDSNINILSSALPQDVYVDSIAYSRDNNRLIINYRKIEKKPKYDSIAQYISVYKPKKYCLSVGDINFSLLDYPHGLITGVTGSGKSYLVRQLIIQALLMKSYVYILDIKRSYQIFRGIANFFASKEEILHTLSEIVFELEHRQQSLDKHLEANPNCLAVDLGYKPIFVVIEEFIALNTVFDSKERKDFDNTLKKLITVGRSVNIHLLIVTQVSSVEAIDSSVRANLSYRICLGSCNETILRTTFGAGVEIPVKQDLKKGEGLVSLDGHVRFVDIPKLTLERDELLSLFPEGAKTGVVVPYT